MPRDSNGNYTLATNPVVGGEPIFADGWANPTLQDIANELGNSLSRDGQGGMRAPFLNADGSISSPGISFGSEPTTGLYRADTGDLRVAIAGVDIARWDSNGLALWNGTGWDQVGAGGANYYSRLDADTAFAANTDYATIPNVLSGVYHYEGVAVIRHSSTGYDTNIDMGIGPAVVSGATAGVASSKHVTASLETAPPRSEIVDSSFIESFVSNPNMNYPANVGNTVPTQIVCRGVAEITSPGAVSWRAFSSASGWTDVEVGTYIQLTKVG